LIDHFFAYNLSEEMVDFIGANMPTFFISHRRQAPHQVSSVSSFSGLGAVGNDILNFPFLPILVEKAISHLICDIVHIDPIYNLYQ
jgi:hypothetical protein